jgi:hypothetical protein
LGDRIFVAGGIRFEVVVVVVVEVAVGDKVRSANGGFGVLALTQMRIRMLAQHRASSD